MQGLLSRFGASWTELALVLVAATVVYGWVVAATRLMGLRSFAKMSAFDFAMTVAVGSIIATAATGNAPLVVAILAVGVLFVAQYSIARLRENTSLGGLVDNTPLLLMYEGRVVEEHLEAARLTHEDLRAKLREANVLRYGQVRAVVFETTGDVTVLHGTGPLDPRLLEGVRCGSVDLDPPAADS